MNDEETYAIINDRGLCIAFQPYNPMDKIEQLEQENAELKAENEQLQALCDTYKTCYQAKHSDIKCLFIKYKQALQDIKELAEEIADTGNWLNCGYNASRAKKILDLIAKAESEE